MQTKANDIQHGGSHYKSKLQHWDWLVELGYGWEYFCAASSKYLVRHRQKNGLQDVQKARHYLEKLLELVQAGKVRLPNAMMNRGQAELTDEFFDANPSIGAQERVAIVFMRYPTDCHELKAAIGIIKAIEATYPEPTQGLTALDFVSEGHTAHTDHWQCRRCRAHLDVPANTDPSQHHKCLTRDSGVPGGGYVDQAKDI